MSHEEEIERYIPTLWDRYRDKIAWVNCDEDDEPQTCYLCRLDKSAGKEFVTGPETSEFICNGCWFALTLQMMSMPDPGYFQSEDGVGFRIEEP